MYLLENNLGEGSTDLMAMVAMRCVGRGDNGWKKARTIPLCSGEARDIAQPHAEKQVRKRRLREEDAIDDTVEELVDEKTAERGVGHQ